MKKLLLLGFAAGVLCLSLAAPSPASAGLTPTCIPYCCNPAVPDTQKCSYNSTMTTCAWFRTPGHSACL